MSTGPGAPRRIRAALAACIAALTTAALTTTAASHGGEARAHTASGNAAPPAAVAVRLSEWRVELSPGTVPAGAVAFTVANGGSIPHAFEVEGGAVERETAQIAPGGRGTLSVTLPPGRYTVYCPVGGDSHKKLGMAATLVVTGRSEAVPAAPRHSRGMDDAPAGTASRDAPHALRITGGGAVVQVLPGPFPFADSAARLIRTRPADQQADLAAKAASGPYSNAVARVSGTVRLLAVDRGAMGDSVGGVADVVARDGARWRIVMDRVQTRDIPFNPRFGGVITGLYYHGASNVHTPLVPTIHSAVALWAYAHVYRNGRRVDDDALVHVMLLSRTRRPGDFHLACWDCSRNPVEELQLQVTTAPGKPKLDAPGGFLFVNWERSAARAVRSR
jgi:plastocyanin